VGRGEGRKIVVDADDLAGRIQKQDPTALEMLLSRFTTDVHAVVATVLGPNAPPDDVEEAAADAFIAAWRHGPGFNPSRASVRTWLLMHARYAALEHRRRQGRRTWERLWLRNGSAPDPCDVVIDAQDHLRIHEALRALPSQDRELLYRRYFLGEDIKHMALALRLSRTAVDTRLSRARKALRERLTARGSEGVDDTRGV
jgi:RNA polymerase sigma-70 factor (ECF subfamily)